MDSQLRRYFIGLVGFGFVACWSAAGFLTALLAAATCVAIVVAPQLSHRERRSQRRPRPIRARPLRDEDPGSLPMVPDEPSLIIEFG
jgi:hypothetical protein